MSNKVPFDKERFCNHCCPGCNKGREEFLAKIEQYKESDPEMVKWLEWYRDYLWDAQVKSDQFHDDRCMLGEDEYKRKVVASLRAMANKIEEDGMHFIIGAELPKLPIFSGDDEIERYGSSISVTIVSGPLGG